MLGRTAKLDTSPYSTMGSPVSDIQGERQLKELRHSTTRSSPVESPEEQSPFVVEPVGLSSSIWERIQSIFRCSKKQDQGASGGRADVRYSSFRGVFYHSQSHRWKAYLWNDNNEKKNLDLGSFFTPAQAARSLLHHMPHKISCAICLKNGLEPFLAYDRAVINARLGDFQALNFNRADYSREMKQLMETSQERLVLLLRKQSAGAGRPQPDYSCTSL